MFNKILIANRGEIALRLVRACKEMGIHPVVVYSLADRDSLHVRFADEGICIGEGPISGSYLNIPNIMSACEISDVEAVHPGYGFLAENTHFAEVCQSHRIKFIGPTPEIINLMGDKIAAKKRMKTCGLPVVPGGGEQVEGLEDAKKTAYEIGYPVIIKAASGGGGRGMRIVHNDAHLASSLPLASQEANASFGDSRIYIEKYIEHSRHVEVQVLGDEEGNIILLGERDCTIQRRYQKLVEESPAPGLSGALRRSLAEAALLAAKSVNYVGAGTVEFLLDESNNFYFMEVNTRLQVEHPVTEMVTGVDIVKEQIRIANGQRLSYKQEDILINGSAIECRINAEDVSKNFSPSPGKITRYNVPGGPGIRVDTHIYSEYTVPSFYDSLLAKLIAHGENRAEAISRMERALEEYVIEGIETTIEFQKKILGSPTFKRGEQDTGFINGLLENP